MVKALEDEITTILEPLLYWSADEALQALQGGCSLLTLSLHLLLGKSIQNDNVIIKTTGRDIDDIKIL